MSKRNHRFSFCLISLLLAVVATVSISCKTTSKGSPDTKSESSRKLTQEEQLQLTALFIDANREKALGNDDKAIGLFAQCIKRNPQYSPAMYEMARMLQERKQYNDALVLAQEAVRKEPNNEWYQILLAGLYIEKKQYSEAAKVMRQLSDKHPSTPDYFFNLADIFLMDNRYNDAVKVYDEIEKSFGISEDVALQKEKIYLQMGKVNKAIEELEKLTAEYPEEIRYQIMLADLYLTSGSEFKGLALYEKILSVNPDNPYVHLSLADYYKMQNKEEKSFEEIQAAFKSPEMDIDTKIRILMQYFDLSKNNQQMLDQAWVLLRMTTEINSGEAKAWSIYGDFLYRDKQMKAAADAYRKAVNLDGSRYPIWEQLMYLDSGLGNYDTLFSESARAMELFPEQAESYLYQGFSATRLKNYVQAVKALKAGLSFASGNDLMVKFYGNLAEASYNLKDYDAAFDYYERALKIDPENLYLLNNYCFFLALQKRNLGRAEELAHKLNKLEPNNPVYEDTYGWVYFMQEHYAQAKTMIAQALSHGGDKSSAILEHYGDVLFKLGEKDAALDYWKKALDAGSTSEVLKKKIQDKNWYNE
jgi:tetratricopeptide (TPR) repeat protein